MGQCTVSYRHVPHHVWCVGIWDCTVPGVEAADTVANERDVVGRGHHIDRLVSKDYSIRHHVAHKQTQTGTRAIFSRVV